MKKRFVTILAVLVLLYTMASPVFASNVTYSGDSGDFIFEPGSRLSPTDLFVDFYNAMPGDVLTQTVTVRNDASKKVKVTIYMRALGTHDGTEDGRVSTEGFLEQLNLTVSTDATENIFHAPANQTAQLTDWYCLGTFESGAEVDLNVNLEIPIELEIQEAVGYIDWEFMVEEEEVPNTGDETNLSLLIGAFAASFVVLLVLVVILIKRRKKAQQN